jgi:hypothetical protein
MSKSQGQPSGAFKIADRARLGDLAPPPIGRRPSDVPGTVLEPSTAPRAEPEPGTQARQTPAQVPPSAKPKASTPAAAARPLRTRIDFSAIWLVA